MDRESKDVSGRDVRDGFHFEAELKGFLQSQGYTAVRSHMSRGAIDVVALHPEKPDRLIQCKLTEEAFFENTSRGADELRQLLDLAERFPRKRVEYAFYRPDGPVSMTVDAVRERLETGRIDAEQGLEPETAAVLKVVDDMGGHAEGLERDAIVQTCRDRDDAPSGVHRVREALDALIATGHLYEPVQGHVKLT